MTTDNDMIRRGDVLDAMCKGPRTVQERIDAIRSITAQPDPRDEVKPHLRLSIARKIGMYGAAYDGPYDARAYTYEHQPGNEPAWNIGKAASNAAKDTAGDYIDGGLSLLRHLSDEGFGVFALNKHDALDVQPDPRDAQIAALVEAAQDYVNRSEEYQIISTDRGGSHGPKGKAFIAVGNAYNAMVAALAAVKGGDA